MVDWLKPCSLSDAKASSRFGPMVPWVLALASSVAGAALLHEERLAVRRVARGDPLDGAAAAATSAAAREHREDGPARATAHRMYTVT